MIGRSLRLFVFKLHKTKKVFLYKDMLIFLIDFHFKKN